MSILSTFFLSGTGSLQVAPFFPSRQVPPRSNRFHRGSTTLQKGLTGGSTPASRGFTGGSTRGSTHVGSCPHQVSPEVSLHRSCLSRGSTEVPAERESPKQAGKMVSFENPCETSGEKGPMWRDLWWNLMRSGSDVCGTSGGTWPRSETVSFLQKVEPHFSRSSIPVEPPWNLLPNLMCTRRRPHCAPQSDAPTSKTELNVPPTKT